MHSIECPESSSHNVTYLLSELLALLSSENVVVLIDVMKQREKFYVITQHIAARAVHTTLSLPAEYVTT